MATVTMNSSKFDVVEYIKKLRNAGVSQEIAEVQAQELEHAIDNVLEQSRYELQGQKLEIENSLKSKELATKGDVERVKLELQKEIEIVRKEIEIVRKEIVQASNKTLLLMGTFGVFFLGVLAKGFHWF